VRRQGKRRSEKTLVVERLEKLSRPGKADGEEVK
jgi:hypothetical protein